MASFLDRIRNSIKAFNTNVTAESYNKFIYSFLGDNIISNNVYDDDYIKKGYSHNTSIYSIINLIIQSSTSVPFKIYKKVDDGAFKEYKSLTTNGLNQESLLQSKLLRKSTFEEIENTGLQKLLETPNPTQSFSTFLAEMIGFGKLTGNRYVYGIYPNTRKDRVVQQLYNLPAHLIEIKSAGIFKPVDKYVMQYRKQKYDLDASEVLHIADWNPDYSTGQGSNLYGQSPIKAAMRVLATNNEAIETQLKYLHNQTAKGMLVPDDDSLTPVQAQQLSDAMQRNFGGSANANKVMITGKKFSWVNFGLSTTDLQLLETYQASIADLANVFGVPVQLLNNTDSSTYDNYRTARKVMFTNAVIPELNRIRDEFNRWLVPQFGEDLYFDFDYTVIPELMPEQQQLVDNLSKSYWLTTNEKREAVGYGVMEDMPIADDMLVPSGFVAISDLDMSVSDDLSFPPKPERAEADANEEPDIVDEEEVEEIGEEEEKQEMSATLRKSLQKKADDHNEKVGDVASKRTNVRTLYAVYKRGIGAYRTNPESVRPNVTGPEMWAMSRVNSFLYVLRNGKFRSGKHDTDLLPEGHPMSSKKSSSEDSIVKRLVDGMTDVYTTEQEAEDRARELGGSGSHSHTMDGTDVFMPFNTHEEYNEAVKETKEEMYSNYPKSAVNNAKRAKEINESFNNPCATLVGKNRASDLIAGRGLSLAIVKKTYSYLSRANEYVTGKYTDEKGKPICGDISYALWGGSIKAKGVDSDPMANWCKRIIEKNEN